MQSHCQVEVRSQDSGTVLAVTGELDLASSPALEAQLERADPSGVVILDLSGLEFMDSIGLRVVLAAYQRAQAAGGRLRLVSAGPQVQRLLTLSGVAERLTAPDGSE